MTKKQKRRLYRIIAGAVLLAASCILTSAFEFDPPLNLAIFLMPYLLSGYDVLLKAVRNISHGQVFDENFLMGIATIGALCIGEYPESVFVMLFYQVGELFQDISVGKSRKSIASLMDIRPDTANVLRGEAFEEVSPEEVQIGETILVKPGERVPLDGIITDGASALDTSALTGESLPRTVQKGGEVISGCVNLSGTLHIHVTKSFGESTVSRILDLVENSAANKAKTENFITRFARYYTPIVVAAAVIIGVIVPLFIGGLTDGALFSAWFKKALIFLVISCPCALVISVPLSFFSGIGSASKKGILVKGSNFIEALSRCRTVVFDKTGTLTKGSFKVTAIHPNEVTPDELLEIAALAESYSTHPISESLRLQYAKVPDLAMISEVQEISGKGVMCKIKGRNICVGNSKLMLDNGIEWRDCHHVGTIVHVASDGEYLGHIVISDEIKEDAGDAVKLLKKKGITKTVMLTGDRKEVGEDIGKRLGLDEVRSELLPDGKVTSLEELLQGKAEGTTLAFVGDGINDAPALSRADIGIAMGALGSDAAIEAADIVLMDDKPSKIADAVDISRWTMKVVKQNITFALGVKFLVMILAAFGFANMWAASFADVGVSVIAIINAMRTEAG